MSHLEIVGLVVVFLVVAGALVFKPKLKPQPVSKLAPTPAASVELKNKRNLPDEEDDDDPFGDKTEPRKWHYELGHSVVVRGLFKQPELFRSGFKDPSTGYGLIEQAVTGIAAAYKFSDHERDDIFKSMSIGHYQHQCADGQLDIYTVMMPKAEVWAECVCFAIAFASDGTPYYYTLELGPPGGGMVLCSWDADHNHLNHGDGPTTAGGFQEAVGENICSRRSRGRRPKVQ